jgi:hypothetical protein
MFELNEEKLMKAQAESKARRMFADMMAETILESDAPESMKMGIRVITKARDVSDTIRNEIVKKYAGPGKTANAETLKYVYEYLSMVEVGIKQFSATTPFVADTEEEENEDIL